MLIQNFLSEVESSRIHFQVLAPWPRSLKSSKIALSLAREQHYFLNGKNFVDCLKNVFQTVFLRLTEKNFKTFFLGKQLHLCPWFLALASSIPVLGLGFFCVLGLEPSVFNSTSVSCHKKNECKNKSSIIFDYLVRVHNDKGLELCGWKGTSE